MKTTSASLLLLAALGLLALAPLSAAPAATAIPYAVRIGRIARSPLAVVEPGITEMTVLRYLGTAHRKLADNVWIYQNYFADSTDADAHGCNTLVLTFTDGRLRDLKIANTSAVTWIAADLKRRAAERQLAAK